MASPRLTSASSSHRLRGGQGTRSGSRVSDQPRERDPRLLVSKRGPPSGTHRGFARLPEVSGTDGSNPLCSSKESRANLISGTMPEGERYFTGSDETGLAARRFALVICAGVNRVEIRSYSDRAWCR